MNRVQQSGQETRRRGHWQLWVLVGVVIFSTLLVTGVALAQQNTSLDFACWSVATGGGGKRTSASLNFMLQDALVGGAAGKVSGGNYQLRAGYAQSWTFLKRSAVAAAADEATTVATVGPAGDNTIHLPLISNFVRITRKCPG